MLGGGTTREDLLLNSSSAAYLTDPGCRPRRAAGGKALSKPTRFWSTPPPGRSPPRSRHLRQRRPSLGLPRRRDDDAPPPRPALARAQLARGAIEIAIVGDLDAEEATIDAVARTFGALPARRGPRSTSYATWRSRASRLPGLHRRDGNPEERSPRLLARHRFRATSVARRMNLLASVLRSLGASSSSARSSATPQPRAPASTRWTSTPAGYLLAGTTVEPSKAKLVTDTIVQIATSSRPTATDDEPKRAKGAWVLTALRESGTNGRLLARQRPRPRAGKTRGARLVPQPLRRQRVHLRRGPQRPAKSYLGAARASPSSSPRRRSRRHAQPHLQQRQQREQPSAVTPSTA